MIQHDKGQAVNIEFLQVVKLNRNGAVENLNLETMRPKTVKDGQIIDHGEPLQVSVETGEYLLMVSRTKIVRKQSGSKIRVQVLMPSGNPYTLADMQWGNPVQKGVEYWRFPQIDFIQGLYALTFSED